MGDDAGETGDWRPPASEQAALDVDALLDRAAALCRAGDRLLAIAGPPGAGKSTLARRIADSTGGCVVPMDGFHLSNLELNRLGRAQRKGAIDTFDADGYVAMVRRIAAADRPVYAPDYAREIEEAVAARILVPADAPLVVFEGNYLLVDQPPWDELKAIFDESWYCVLDEKVRLDRLIARHHEFGKSLQAARAWATGSDQRNADVIAASCHRADVLARTG